MPGHPRLGVRIVVDAACFARVDPARDAAFDRGSGRGSRPGVPAGVRDRLAARGDRSARPRAPGSRAPSRRRSIFDFPLAFFPGNRRPIARVARRSQPLVRHLCRGNIPLPPKKSSSNQFVNRRARSSLTPARTALSTPVAPGPLVRRPASHATRRARSPSPAPKPPLLRPLIPRPNAPTTFAMQKPTKWKHNFSAGPSVVDPGVLAKLSAELASFEDTGMVRARVPRALARFARRTHRDASRDTRRIPPRAPLVTFRRPNRLATTPPV